MYFVKDNPPGSALVVAGDLNTDLGGVAGVRRGTEISAALTEAGLVDMATHSCRDDGGGVGKDGRGRWCEEGRR